MQWNNEQARIAKFDDMQIRKVSIYMKYRDQKVFKKPFRSCNVNFVGFDVVGASLFIAEWMRGRKTHLFPHIPPNSPIKVLLFGEENTSLSLEVAITRDLRCKELQKLKVMTLTSFD